jgi:hypothetical protein
MATRWRESIPLSLSLLWLLLLSDICLLLQKNSSVTRYSDVENGRENWSKKPFMVLENGRVLY